MDMEQPIPSVSKPKQGYKTIALAPKTYERLKATKRDDEKWDQFINRLLDQIAGAVIQ